MRRIVCSAALAAITVASATSLGAQKLFRDTEPVDLTFKVNSLNPCSGRFSATVRITDRSV